MLTDANVHPTVPVRDLSAARSFYEKRLGLESEGEPVQGHLQFRVGDKTQLIVYERPGHTAAPHTLASFEIADVEGTVQRLQDQGVTFEEYDLPEMNLVTENGIATMDGTKVAWFKDPDGNVLAVSSLDH